MNDSGGPRRAVPAVLAVLGVLSLGLACRPAPSGEPSPAETQPESLPLPTGARLDPAGPAFDVGNMPLAVAVAPGTPERLVLLLSGYREQGLQVADPAAGRVLQTLPQPGAFIGLAFAPDGRTLYASGGDDDSIFRYDWRDGAAALRDRIVLEPKETPEARGRRFPAGLAVSPDGARLYVAENLSATLAVVDAASGRVLQRLPAGPLPYGVAAAPDGTVWVSAWGGNSVASFAPDPADAAGGLKASGAIEVGRHPSALLLGAGGRRLFVASATTNRIAVVDTAARRVLATLEDPPPSGPNQGSTPNALALSGEGTRLFVAEGDANAVAVFDLSAGTSGVAGARGQDRLAGRVPSRWYPAALAREGETLYVVDGKGRGAGPNPQGPQYGKPFNVLQYTLGQLNGTVTTLRTGWSRAELADLTRRVERANGWDRPRGDRNYPPFQHVIYILKENRTYDQVFGDQPGGDGDPSLQFFPREVAPNHRALAERFGLFDRFFVNAEVSAQGHIWSTAAYVTDYGEKVTPSNYSDKRQDPEEKEHREAEEPAGGFLWHLAQEKGITFRNFGEATEAETQPDGTVRWRATLSGLDAFTDPDYPGYDLQISDQRRADVWLERLRAWERTGDMPVLQLLWLPNDHTSGARPGLPTPRAYMADNDRALGRIIEALSQSRFWKDTVVFVLEDDAQAGPDHVDSHRSVLLVISPYNRPGTVHRFVNTTGVLATIEEILGLRSLSHFDHFGRTLAGLFAAEPDLRPYQALQPSVPWTEVNPPAGPGSMASAELELEEVDSGQDDLFNRVLWQAIKGDVPFPGTTYATLLDLERGK